ncbi:MAG: ABC transporter ATP-binding protein [Verrucomicrobiae bacterium]|nr:ABC transporter ATP-binding protein [Verrucomicrobiae bacterium]
MSTVLELPSYLKQSPEVAARLARLKARPVELEVKGLTKRFMTPDGGTVTALKEINLSVHRREFMSVLGASGCGKSTFVRIVAGLETPTEGEVLLGGKAIRGPGPDRGMVFQGYTLFPWLSVKQNVMFGLEACGSSPTGAESDALQWIDLVGLAKFADAYPHQLSGGMKQRVAIARALANQPPVMLMDEPYGALDPQTRGQMQSYLLQIWENVDVTILFITHDLDEAIYLSDRILVLSPNPGQVLEIVEVPLSHPRSPEQFLSPEFLATKQRIEELIHPNKHASDDKLPMIRLTKVGDDVN